MTAFASITLENEMDLILAYKKSIRMGELLRLAISTQTAFATAVSEVCREVIDKALDGMVSIGVASESNRYFLNATISCTTDEYFKTSSEGFEYARKLIPILETETDGKTVNIILKLGIPRSNQVDQRKVNTAKRIIEQEGPISAYEELKIKNAELNQVTQERELALIHANYLNEQKNEFLSVASHELNSPLTVLRSLTQLALRMDNGGNEKLAGFLRKIDIQSGKLVTLIQQLMDISKIEHGKMVYNREATDLNEFLRAALDSIGYMIPTHNLSTDFDQTCNVTIDRIRLEQVLNNLVVNAAKYSEAGSQIFVKTTQNGNTVMIGIKDEGIGMTEDTITNVFKKFYRSEDVVKKYSGLGMGLYIASKIIADHQGSINVISTEGEGSEFSFTLPLNVA